MLEKRVKGEPCAFPPWVVPEAQDLIQRLIIADPAERLGSKSGALEAKEHRWVGAVDWNIVYRRQAQPCFPNFPPIIPSAETATNFASEFTAQQAPEDLRTMTKGEASHPTVEGFSQEVSIVD